MGTEERLACCLGGAEDAAPVVVLGGWGEEGRVNDSRGGAFCVYLVCFPPYIYMYIHTRIKSTHIYTYTDRFITSSTARRRGGSDASSSSRHSRAPV